MALDTLTNTAEAAQDAIQARQQPSASQIIIEAAKTVLNALSRGQPITSAHLSAAMTAAAGATDAAGAWAWKDAYEAAEVAEVMFLKRFLPTMIKNAKHRGDTLAMLRKVANLLPTHTKRSEESVGMQQFSTPPELAHIAAIAAAITPDDVVLEPSAGTGLLAVHAEAMGSALMLNELADTRADLLATVFHETPVTRLNGEHLDDLLPGDAQPTVVLMNPPFSASPGMAKRSEGADLRHLRSALARLADGGRLVAITSTGLTPENNAYADAFASLARTATLQLTVAMPGEFFRKHGTTIETRLTVFDKVPAPQGHVSHFCPMPIDAEDLLSSITSLLPKRQPLALQPKGQRVLWRHSTLASRSGAVAAVTPLPSQIPAEEVTYAVVDDPRATTSGGQELYAPYAPERIKIHGAQPHPDKLVQSAAMASVAPPKPSYLPHLPAGLVADGTLTAPQLEAIIYAGEAHAKHLAGHYVVADTYDVMNAAPAGDANAVQFRRGFFLGDGTGVGKGRQVAGIILDNWLKGRRKALWISKSDKLLEDAQRDWSALRQERLQIVPQSRFKQSKPIALSSGILFTTYATLRSESQGKGTRLAQLIEWLGPDFDGVIIFDEAHAMGNAGGTKTEFGNQRGSLQGIAGLKLQHALPDARVVYVSATGATTVENLAYAQRLGLWGSDDLPFETREGFVTAMLEGGIASAEVLARDLKSLGLYTARSLSYEGIVVDILEHPLTREQIAIYDRYADAYQVIHAHLAEALRITNILNDKGETRDRNAKSAAKSAFEGNKQRFFQHLLTAMSVPSLIREMELNLARGEAPVIQLVSTSEALMERRLADVNPSEWEALDFDVTPREYCLDYLKNSFPTQLFEPYTDADGNECARPVKDTDGNYVQSREAVALRDSMIEELAALPPVQAALDQIIHHFGTDLVAEVTGRSRRIVKHHTSRGDILKVESRTASANLSETQAFMDDVKRILIFSDAGGTGRSYHADLASKNQRQRIHYLLEPGWKADTAIQGLGRTNRTNQRQKPLFRPVTTNVKGQRRFTSTIARRLDSLGAITRGERKTGGQGLFRASDNLETPYARSALSKFYHLIHAGKIACCSYQRFVDATGLVLHDRDHTLKDELPPIHTFLNRILALQINLQNDLFVVFEGLITERVEDAIAKGTYEVGLETVTADSLHIASRTVVAVNTGTGSKTELIKVGFRRRTSPVLLEQALSWSDTAEARLLHNPRSGRAALQLPTASITEDDGTVTPRVKLVRPTETQALAISMLEDTLWEETDPETFGRLWSHEVSQVPEFTSDTFYILTGLLLPLWKRLPKGVAKVYRLTTDDGISLIGRVVPDALVDVFAADTGTMKPEACWAELRRGATVTITPTLRLRPVTLMGERRFELEGFDGAAIAHLKAMGLFTEVIKWKTRAFVPTDDEGRAVISRLLGRYAASPVAA